MARFPAHIFMREIRCPKSFKAAHTGIGLSLPAAVMALVAVALVACCPGCHNRSGAQPVHPGVTHNTAYPQEIDPDSSNLVYRIHENMTFAEIARLIQIYTNGLNLVEHGGIWYNASVGSNWIVKLRFENRPGNLDPFERKLNYPPIVRRKLPDEIIGRPGQLTN